MSHFEIECRACGRRLKDTYCAFCEHCLDSLLITKYNEENFENKSLKGVWRFNWLPVHGGDFENGADFENIKGFEQAGPIVYKSSGLAQRLGLSQLYIAFNGYWPEKGALLETCTFKEFEAAVVIRNARENGVNGLVAASAGNTARAFCHLSHVSGFPVIIIVPRMCLRDMWYLENTGKVPTLALLDGDYADSIDIARKAAGVLGMPFEGGVKNIAKRDGLGIVMLEAVSKIGRLPEYYFQAVGSGTGAIAAWEMSERFLALGKYGAKLPSLHLAQNLPFAPMAKAWQAGKRELDPHDLDPKLIVRITTRVLSTRYPAYSIKGGVFDALRATEGKMYGVENKDVFRAMALWEESEGIDIVPASGVAVAALWKAALEGDISKDALVLLNITGGGEKRLKKDRKTFPVKPVYITKNISLNEIEGLLCKTLKRAS
jgi:cysteate synthase